MNSFFRATLPASLILCNLFILNGCGLFSDDTPPLVIEPVPFTVELNLNASPELNPDIEGSASPLVVRIYQLESIAAFNHSDFFALYENDQALIGKDIKYREELEIRPGQKISNQHKQQAGARYIAVFAAYRDLDHAQWKTFIKMKLDRDEMFNVDLGKVSVSIARSTE